MGPERVGMHGGVSGSVRITRALVDLERHNLRRLAERLLDFYSACSSPPAQHTPT